MSIDVSVLISFAVALATAVAVLVTVIHLVRADGYGRSAGPASRRTDWGSSALPSAPYVSRLG